MHHEKRVSQLASHLVNGINAREAFFVLKKCKKFGNEFPATSEFFPIKKGNKDGLSGHCRICHRLVAKKWYSKNRDEVLEYNTKWRNNNKEIVASINKAHYEANKEKLKIVHKIWYENNKNKHLATSKIWYKNNLEKHLKTCKKWRELNRDRCLENHRNWKISNKDKVKASSKRYIQKHKSKLLKLGEEYRQNNKEKISQKAREYRKTEKAKLILAINRQKRRTLKNKLDATFSKTQWLECKKYFNDKCCYCGDEKELAQEHFVALSKGGEYSKNNIVPSCNICNSKKGISNFFEWYPRQIFYNKKRENKILEYLNYHKQTKAQQLAFI